MVKIKKFQRRLISKEKKYLRRLRGDYRFQYLSKRRAKLGIKKNKIRANSAVKLYIATITFPKNFCIYNAAYRNTTLNVCNDILCRGKHVMLNLVEVESFTAAATAYLLSTTHKAQSLGITVRCNRPRNIKCRAVLQKVGFLELVGHVFKMPESEVNSYSDVKRWYVHKGINWNGEELHQCISEFTNEHLDGSRISNISPTHRKKIGINIKELIGNVLEHAYPANYRLDRHWILFGMYSEDKEELVLVLSDSGKTIPKTYVQYHKSQPSIKEALGKKHLKTDDSLIEMAVKEKISGTKLEGRGYGLKSVERSVTNTGGSLWIFSRKGQYTNGKSVLGVKLRNSSKCVNGTIINISLPLEVLK